MECYVPTKIAERCFLPEAILWLLLREVPKLEFFSPEGGDERFPDDRESNVRHWGDLTSLTDADCEKLGIPPNPAAELVEDYYYFDPKRIYFSTLDLLDRYEGTADSIAESVYKEHTREEIEEARKMRVKHSEWLEIVSTKLELPKVTILKSILQGDLPVFCRNRIDRQLYEDENPDDVDPGSDGWFVNQEDPRPFVEAPLHIFKATEIDWEESSSTVGDMIFNDICVDTGTLLREFPDPDEYAITAVRVGDVLLAKDDGHSTSNRPQRGRPSLPWAEMHQELGRRIERGIIPDKKEALVAELMDWCRTKWGRVVSRSAIQSQLRNFRHAQKP